MASEPGTTVAIPLSQTGQQKETSMVTMNLKKTVLILASLLSMKAAADSSDLQNVKVDNKIDFNQLIEEGNEKRQELVKEQASAYVDEDKATEDGPAISATERKSVVDFIDVEVGVGKTPSVVGVDRRYNSVGNATRVPNSIGEAKIVDLDKLKVTLLNGKKKGS
jgi:hypothetical protein